MPEPEPEPEPEDRILRAIWTTFLTTRSDGGDVHVRLLFMMEITHRRLLGAGSGTGSVHDQTVADASAERIPPDVNHVRRVSRSADVLPHA